MVATIREAFGNTFSEQDQVPCSGSEVQYYVTDLGAGIPECSLDYLPPGPYFTEYPKGSRKYKQCAAEQVPSPLGDECGSSPCNSSLKEMCQKNNCCN